MSEPNGPSLSDADERRRRQEALRNLAQRELGAPPASSSQRAPAAPRPSMPAPRLPAAARGRPGWVIPVGAVLVVLLVAGVILYQLGLFPGLAAHNHSAPSTIVIAPSLQGLECPHDVAWSPNGQEVAVVGYVVTCPGDLPSEYNYQAGVVNIYSAVTGKLVQTISPDATVLALPGLPEPSPQVQPASAASDTTKPVINYTHVLWSPSGKELALTFYIDRWTTSNSFGAPPFGLLSGVSGLVLMNANGSDERTALFTGVKLQNSLPGSLISLRYAATEWHTSTLKAVPLPAHPLVGDLVSLPAAPTYSWSSSGQVVPGSASSGATSPGAGIGNPDGGSTFSMWQPGIVGFFNSKVVNNSPVPVSPGVYAWSSSFVAWSPDGRYLIDNLMLLGTVHPAGEPLPTAAGLQAFDWEHLGNVGIRDRAMQRLLTSLQPAPFDLSYDHVAWSPNGRVLAAMPEEVPGGNPSGQPASQPVTLYDSATGRTLGTVRTGLNTGVTSNDLSTERYLSSASDLVWSADGSHLLDYDDQAGTITIWGPAALPKD